MIIDWTHPSQLTLEEALELEPMFALYWTVSDASLEIPQLPLTRRSQVLSFPRRVRH